MDISVDQLRDALLYLIAFVVSIAVHEFGHAITADKLGDGLPRAQGRVTLSPLAHYDLVGTILLPLVGTFASGVPLLAWGKPVQVNPRHYTPGTRVLVSVMGPAMNLALAVVASLVVLALAKTHVLHQALALVIVQFIVTLNLRLLFFNLIPIPPLDGGFLLDYFLPSSLQIVSQTLRRYGMVLLYVLLLTGVINQIMKPADELTIAWARALLRQVPS